MSQLTGKCFVITGGTSGIGLEIVNQSLRNGAAKVAIFDLRDTNNVVANLNKEFPDQVIFFETDVGDKTNVSLSFEQVKTRFGRIDIVIGNAGICDEEQPELMIKTNLLGVINTTYAAIDYMSKTNGGGGGIVLTVASVASLDCSYETPVYTASKHGVIGFMRCFGHTFYTTLHGITFLSICPGLTDTALLNEGKRLPFDEVETERFFAGKRMQTARQAADGAIKILQHAKHGSIWLVDGGETEEVTFVQHWKNS